jgi:hypothetical protein
MTYPQIVHVTGIAIAGPNCRLMLEGACAAEVAALWVGITYADSIDLKLMKSINKLIELTAECNGILSTECEAALFERPATCNDLFNLQLERQNLQAFW